MPANVKCESTECKHCDLESNCQAPEIEIDTDAECLSFEE